MYGNCSIVREYITELVDELVDSTEYWTRLQVVQKDLNTRLWEVVKTGKNSYSLTHYAYSLSNYDNTHKKCITVKNTLQYNKIVARK